MRLIALALAALPILAVPAARAEEAKAPVNAILLLNTFTSSAPARGVAYDEALRDRAPALPGGAEGEVLPDGSVRYGKVIVTVRNPCPPSAGHYDTVALPGRRSR